MVHEILIAQRLLAKLQNLWLSIPVAQLDRAARYLAKLNE